MTAGSYGRKAAACCEAVVPGKRLPNVHSFMLERIDKIAISVRFRRYPKPPAHFALC